MTPHRELIAGKLRHICWNKSNLLLMPMCYKNFSSLYNSKERLPAHFIALYLTLYHLYQGMY